MDKWKVNYLKKTFSIAQNWPFCRNSATSMPGMAFRVSDALQMRLCGETRKLMWRIVHYLCGCVSFYPQHALPCRYWLCEKCCGVAANFRVLLLRKFYAKFWRCNLDFLFKFAWVDVGNLCIFNGCWVMERWFGWLSGEAVRGDKADAQFCNFCEYCRPEPDILSV